MMCENMTRLRLFDFVVFLTWPVCSIMVTCVGTYEPYVYMAVGAVYMVVGVVWFVL